MVRVGMGLIKNEHGVYHVRRKVPKALEEATAIVTGVSKTRVSRLKETLGTKDEKQAKVRAKPIMMKCDGILAKGWVGTLDLQAVRRRRRRTAQASIGQL
jgi:hypothetical protein